MESKELLFPVESPWSILVAGTAGVLAGPEAVLGWYSGLGALGRLA